MSIIAFCGPTLGGEEVVAKLDAQVRPPAARGDILAAAATSPDAILLIDGCFDRVPSVWHKEILWAMAQGIRVFGAASMGALRAAELAAFGMVGVGRIFEAYLSGRVEDDDEVAVTHGDAHSDFRAFSEAMVNVRATFEEATRQHVISEGARDLLLRAAKDLYYPDRIYPAILKAAEAIGVTRVELDSLVAWLPDGRVDQKRKDALELLEVVVAERKGGWSQKTVDFSFARTDTWEGLVARADFSPGGSLSSAETGTFERDLAEEVLLDGRNAELAAGALARALAYGNANDAGLKPSALAVEQTIEDFRRERQLLQSSDFQDWLDRQRLSGADTLDYFRRETSLRRLSTMHRNLLAKASADELRAAGVFERLERRAQEKRDFLSAQGLDRPTLSDTRMTETELWQWYFGDCLNREAPRDIHEYARQQRTEPSTLQSAVTREFFFRQRDQLKR